MLKEIKSHVKRFYTYQAQTSPHPLAKKFHMLLEVIFMILMEKAYLDFVAGVSACTLGHQHPRVKRQLRINLISTFM